LWKVKVSEITARQPSVPKCIGIDQGSSLKSVFPATF
jgi:hypothetical protein